MSTDGTLQSAGAETVSQPPRRIDEYLREVLAKNGSDLTTWATQVAREHTDRNKIVMVTGTYHGAHAWCTPGHGGVTPAYFQDVRAVSLKHWLNFDRDSMFDETEETAPAKP